MRPIAMPGHFVLRRVAVLAAILASQLAPIPTLGPLASSRVATAGTSEVTSVTDRIVGYGRYTTGGADGRRVRVTNLNGSGPGSLRAAMEGRGRRMVVFRTAGTIRLRGPINVTNPYLTVAGETAPAPGITVHGSVVIRAPQVVISHLRLRPGDRVRNPDEVDALTLNGARRSIRHVAVNHVTMLWGPDIGGLAILGDVSYVTIQNSIMGEGLYLSAHREGTRRNGGHSHAANVSRLRPRLPAPRRLTFWRNLFTTSDSRVPRLQGAQCVDVVNNVIYNWGTKSAHGNPRSLNLVANWYRSGPETRGSLFWKIQRSELAPTAFLRAVYMVGNKADGFRSKRDRSAHVYSPSPRCGGLSVRRGPVGEAYRAVIEGAGAMVPVRDAVDRRVIANVERRSGRFFNGAGRPAPNPYYP